MLLPRGQLNSHRASLRDLLAPTRAEPGCNNYDLHVSREQPGFFVLHENWENDTLWQAHMSAPHIEGFKGLNGRAGGRLEAASAHQNRLTHAG
jgi:quinol monooxygenase YgiN